MYGLILLLFSIIPANDIAGNKQLDIDKLELNHIYEESGNFQSDQLIFWKIYEDEFVPIMFLSLTHARDNDWNVRAAVNAQGFAYVPKFNWPYEFDKRPNSSITLPIHHLGYTIPVKINYKIFAETHTDFDNEIDGKNYLEEQYKTKDPEKWERIKKHLLINKDWVLQHVK